MAARKWVGKASATAQTSANSSGAELRIAVVGTGVAALMCVRSLAKKIKSDSALGSARISFCTSRGKLATQMGPKNQTLPQPGKPFFDYGCQYFTASHPMFAEEVERWASLGCAQALPEGSVGTISESQAFQPLTGDKCWVGNGGMGPMLTKLIEQTVQEFGGVVEHVCGFPDESKKVTGLAKTESGWQLSMKGGTTLGPFDFVVGAFAQHVLTDPFLLSGGAPCERILKCLRKVESNQLIPIQVSLEGEPISTRFCAAHVQGQSPLSFICNNSQKPQQNGKIGTPGPSHWTLISTAKFAEEQFNLNNRAYKRVAEEEMLSAFAKVVGVKNLNDHRPHVNRLNHWEDGLPTTIPPNSQGCLLDVEHRLGWCGDFCVLPGIQGAALSGIAMADTIEKVLSKNQVDATGLLPSDDAWLPIAQLDQSDATIVDIGAFSSKLGLKSVSTHTDLVPSAINGYNKAAHTGDAYPSKGKGSKSDNQQSSKGKSKGKSKGYSHTKGKGKYY